MSATSLNMGEAALTNRQRILSILKASCGNLLEWAGFYFYIYYSIYFSRSFFPNGDPTIQLMQAALVFAAGSVARPFGGWFYGRLADHQGRRKAMIHSGFVMFSGSLLLAVTPSYATIGYAAPLLLFCARLLQSLSVGGNYGTSATYMSEVAIKNQRGFLGSFQYATLLGGQFVAVSTIVILESLLTKAQLLAWGWRIPFVLGALGSLLTIWLRLSLQESISSKKPNQPASNLKELLRYKREVMTIFVTTAAGSSCFYTFTVYMQKYLMNSLGLASNTANLMLAGALGICICLQPLFGTLSDRIGRLKPMLLFSGIMTFATLPIAYYLLQTSSIYIAFGLLTLTLTILSFYTSISGLIKAELFPAEVRALGVGVSYSVANAIFGGSAEPLALWFKAMGMEFGFYAYLTVLCFLSFLMCVRYLPQSLAMNYLEKK